MKKFLKQLPFFALIGLCALIFQSCNDDGLSNLQTARTKSRTVNSANRWINFVPNEAGTQVSYASGSSGSTQSTGSFTTTFPVNPSLSSGVLLDNGTAVFAWVDVPNLNIKYVIFSGVNQGSVTVSAVQTLTPAQVGVPGPITFGSNGNTGALLITEESDPTTQLGEIAYLNADGTFGTEIQLAGDPDAPIERALVYKLTISSSGDALATMSYSNFSKIYYSLLVGGEESSGFIQKPGDPSLTLNNVKTSNNVFYISFSEWDGTTDIDDTFTTNMYFGTISVSDGFDEIFDTNIGTPSTADILVTLGKGVRFYFNAPIPAVTSREMKVKYSDTTGEIDETTLKLGSDAPAIGTILTYASVDNSNIVALIGQGSLFQIGGNYVEGSFFSTLLTGGNATNPQVLVTPDGTIIVSYLDADGNLQTVTTSSESVGNPLLFQLKQYGNAKFLRGVRAM